MSASNVLLIDVDKSRRETLTTLVEFINCQPLVVNDPDVWFEDAGDLNDIVMALVGDCGDKHQTKQVLRELVNHEARVPVYVVDVVGDGNIDFPGTLGQLSFPIKYPQLSNALQQATIFKGQSETKKPTAYRFQTLSW
jgi:sigma-54 specific flagellar transcriptional regulator A